MSSALRSTLLQVAAALSAAIATLDAPAPESPSTRVQEFIDARLHEVCGSRVRFAEFYRRFLDFLPPGERKHWSKIRLSKALPKEHPSGTHTDNVTFVANIAFAPCDPQPYEWVKDKDNARLVKRNVPVPFSDRLQPIITTEGLRWQIHKGNTWTTGTRADAKRFLSTLGIDKEQHRDILRALLRS